MKRSIIFPGERDQSIAQLLLVFCSFN